VSYTPDRRDFMWFDFDPQAGHEQAGRRPALVLSPRTYNERVGLVIVCPVTSRIKGHLFEVHIPSGLPISGVVLSDQIRSLDLKARNPAFIVQVSEAFVKDVLARLDTLLRA